MALRGTLLHGSGVRVDASRRVSKPHWVVTAASLTTTAQAHTAVRTDRRQLQHRQKELLQILNTIINARPLKSNVCHSDDLELFEQVYEAVEEVFLSKRGYIVSAKEQKQIEATGGSSIYGELLPEGINAMLKILLPSAGPGSVFLDLGSGLGRVVLQAAVAGGPSKAFDQLVGVELSDSRLEQSEVVLQALREQLGLDPVSADALSRVDFLKEDATCTRQLQCATHVFMCSTAFGSVACRRIVDALAVSPSFRVLVTSRELPFQPHMRMLGTIPCATSWHARGSLCFYVRRDFANAPPALLQHFLSRDGVAWLPTDQLHVPISAQEPIEGWKYTYL